MRASNLEDELARMLPSIITYYFYAIFFFKTRRKFVGSENVNEENRLVA